MKTTLLTIAAALLFNIAAAQAAEPEAWPAWRAPMIERFDNELKELDKALVASPDSVPFLSRRGDHHLFLGHFPQAVADYERMIAIDPAQDAPHWRLGIAYYFTGQFAKSARQFEKYHDYDGRDRENGVWKFLAQARAENIEKARAGMLVYTRFDREPFPSLYEMFAGKKSTDDMLAEIASKGLEKEPNVVFFGNYYGGLNESLLGHRQRAVTLLEKAVKGLQETGSAERDYMWQVARLQWELLRSAAANESAPAK
jgi:lipoprotein NlpI